MTSPKPTPLLLWTSRFGRAALGSIFVLSGLGKLADLQGTAAFMQAAHMPAVPLLLAGTIGVEVVGGLSVMSGFRARWGALALVAMLIPATLLFHAFWGHQGMERQMQMMSFLKNISILGGLLYLFAMESVPAK